MYTNVLGQGSYRFKTYRAGTKELLRTSGWTKNLISTANGHGLNILARRLCNNKLYDLVITEAKIGTGTTAAAITDTDIETVAAEDILVANQSYSGGVATLEFFISDDELADGTYTEFSVHCGTQLFSRSIISPSYTKADNEDTLVEYVFTFENAP